MYGIGASLDPAGVRFSIVLIMIAFLLCKDQGIWSNKWKITAFGLAFCIISLIGNMISRTTTIGMAIGLGYVLLSTGVLRLIIKMKYRKLYGMFSLVLILVIGFAVFLYHSDSAFHHDLRFGFEGFFKWIERGEWTTNSTEKLNRTMWIWPTDINGWLIGKGLFDNYAFGTDIGYCRLILYCGIIGFSIFALFFVYNAYIFARKYPIYRDLFIALLLLSFIVWIKVSTDLFLIYALFYCMNNGEWKNEELVKKRCHENHLLH
jgi:hypothetical protein